MVAPLSTLITEVTVKSGSVPSGIWMGISVAENSPQDCTSVKKAKVVE